MAVPPGPGRPVHLQVRPAQAIAVADDLDSLGAAVAFARAGVATVGGIVLAAILAGSPAMVLWIDERLRVPAGRVRGRGGHVAA